MASDLIPFSVSAPGFFGLNLQDSPISLPPEFALEASNCVIDRLGRVGARKGWQRFSDYDAGIDTDAVTLIHELIVSAGTAYVYFVANGKIWELDTSDGSVSSIYTGTWTNAGTYAGDAHWKAVSFNGYVWMFKRGEDPLRITPGSPSTVAKINAVAGYAGTVQQANEVLSAYGRLWTADTSSDKLTLKWSDTLIGQAWSGGASGSLSLETVLTNGTRPIVALAAFNGFLVIFCDTSIIVYRGADVDPAVNIELVEVIDGVGCVSRDSVQDVGSDILFLSNTGVRSLGRIISEKSAPIFDISRNIRDVLLHALNSNANDEEIKSVYNQIDGFYSLSFINENITFCFDLKNRLENDVCRVTTWTLVPYCYFVDKEKRMLMGFDGFVGNYAGYNDNDTETYVFSYKTSHFNGEAQNDPSGGRVAPFYKILKNWRNITISSGDYHVSFLWGFDYKGLPNSRVKILGEAGSSGLSEYGIAEYGLAEYSGSSTWAALERVSVNRFPISGYGQVFQLGIRTTIDGDSFSIQQIGVTYKPGRLA